MANYYINPNPVIYPQKPDGTQEISIMDRKGYRRIIVSSPEKIDEYINTRENNSKIRNIYSLKGGIGAFVITSVIGAFFGKKVSEHVINGFLVGLTGGICGAFTGFMKGLGKTKHKDDEAVKNLELTDADYHNLRSKNKPEEY